MSFVAPDYDYFVAWANSNFSGSYNLIMQEGVLPSEVGADTGLTTGPYYGPRCLVANMAGQTLRAGTYVVNWRCRADSVCTNKAHLIVDGTTDYASGINSYGGAGFEHTAYYYITVGADTPIEATLEVELEIVTGTMTFWKFHDENLVGVRAGYAGMLRRPFVMTLLSPAAGSHAAPTIVDGPPTFDVELERAYPADVFNLVRYVDTVPGSAHSASSASTQTSGALSTLTTALVGSEFKRRASITADATRKPITLADTYYDLRVLCGSNDIGGAPMHAYLNAAAPSLNSLNGVSAAEYVTTTEITPVVRWTDPNAATDRWRVRVYNTSDVEQHDSGEVVDGSTTYVLPSTLDNLTTLYAVVQVSKGTDWSVDSARGYFQVDQTSTALKITSHEGSVDAPEIIVTRAPTLAWTFPKTQAGLNVVAVKSSDQSVEYTSGWVASATQSHTLPANTLDLGEDYSIQVQVKDLLGVVYTSDKRAWVHVQDAAVAAPALTAESDATTADAVLLEWAAPSVGDGDSLTYEVEMTAPDDAPLVSAVGAALSWLLGRLSAGTYSWRVRATDEHGMVGSWAAADTFVISQAGSVPTCALAPWGPSTGTPVISTWTYADVDGDQQDAYQMQTATDAGFTTGLVDTGTVASTAQYYQHGTLAAGTYYRRVRVRTNATDWSDWDADTITILAATTQANDLEIWRV